MFRAAITPYKTAGLLGVLALALYGGSASYGFVSFDDQRILLGQPYLFDPPAWGVGVFRVFEALPREEPLIIRDLTWLLETTFFGFGNPFPHHVGSILLNALNSILCFVLVRRTTQNDGLALAVAVAFTLVPLHVEPVCWVMGRKDVLSASFVLLILLLQDTRMSRGRRDGTWWGLAALQVVLVPMALLSKISAVVVVPLLFLQHVFRPWMRGELAPSAPLPPSRICAAFVASLPAGLIALAVVVWYHAQLTEFGILPRGPSVTSSAAYLGVLATFIPVVLKQYAWLLVAPFDLQIFYDYPAVGRPVAGFDVAIGVLLIAGLAVSVVGAWRARKELLFPILAVPVAMLPFLNFTYIGIWVANRYAYLAVLFVFWSVFGAIQLLIRRIPRLRWSVAVVAAAYGVMCVWLTGRHQTAFENNQALWEHDAAVDHASMLALQALARVHIYRAENAVDPQERRRALEAALTMVERTEQRYQAIGFAPQPGYTDYPTSHYAKALHYRGRALALLGAPLHAQIEVYRRALEADPRSRLHYYQLAAVHRDVATRTSSTVRVEHLEASLQYFEGYAAASMRNAHERSVTRRRFFALYGGAFPDEEERIRRARRDLQL